jgi:hypothetical protein
MKSLNGIASNLFLLPNPTTGLRAKKSTQSTGCHYSIRPKEEAFHRPSVSSSLISTLKPRRGIPSWEKKNHLCCPQPQPKRFPFCCLSGVEVCSSLGVSVPLLPHRQSGSPASDCDPLCPETVPPSQLSYPRAASPRMKKEDSGQTPGTPEQDGTVNSIKTPAEPAGTSEVSGPVASCQEPRASVGVSVNPPGTPVSGSPANQCLVTSSGFVDLSPGPDLALAGHKRKVQFPSGNAEKRPGASWSHASFFVPRVTSPCGARTTGSRHLLSLPLLVNESRSLASLLPLCHPQTCLSLPGSFPCQYSDRPAELWATQPPWPGGGWLPESEDSKCAAPGFVS